MRSALIIAILMLLPLIGPPPFIDSPILVKTPQETNPAHNGISENFAMSGAGLGQGYNGRMARNGHGPMGGPYRNRPTRTAAGCAQQEIRRDPADIDVLSLFRRELLRGYRRLSEKTILLNENRRRIYELILKNPGIDIVTIENLLGISHSTIRYHLDLLLRLRKITIMDIGSVNRYYENHGRYDDRERTMIGRYWYNTTRKIFLLIQSRPGISRGEIAESLGISGPSTTRWLHRCVKEELLREERDGKYTRYYLSVG